MGKENIRNKKGTRGMGNSEQGKERKERVNEDIEMEEWKEYISLLGGVEVR